MTEEELHRQELQDGRDRYLADLKDGTDEEVLERCAQFAEEYRARVAAGTGRGWGRIGDRLHEECGRRDLLHS